MPIPRLGTNPVICDSKVTINNLRAFIEQRQSELRWGMRNEVEPEAEICSSRIDDFPHEAANGGSYLSTDFWVK